MDAKCLLVVDDEVEFCDFVRTVAEGLGYRVETCTSGRQAIARFDAISPDLVVLDVVMPDVEGIQIVQELANRNVTSRIVMVTGFNPGYAEAARAIGTARGIARIDIMTKPVRVEQLRAMLRSA